MTDRYEPFRRIARNQSLEAIALVPGANFARLFGQDFHQNERPLLVLIPTDGQVAAVVPHLELGSFASLGFEGEVFGWKDESGYQQAFNQLLHHYPIRSVGVEGQVMRVFVDQALRAALDSIRIVDAQQHIAALRLCKDKSEIEALKHAISISENALANTIDRVEVGMSERAIESILIQQLFASGAEDLAFSPIVAASTNSANPHGHSRDDYFIAPGDSLLIDFGARAGGVCADITRTFFIQRCSDEHREIYDTVLDANFAGIKATRAGVSAHDVDDAAMIVDKTLTCIG